MDMAKLTRVDIAITSYLGDTREKQEIRLDYHKRQRVILSELFPHLRIVSICSAYPQWARKELGKLLQPSKVVHFAKRMHKYQKHEIILRELYSRKNQATLLLDDDTIPYKVEDIPIDPFDQIWMWLQHPREMPAPCIFFSLKGSLKDVFYRKRQQGLVQCPCFPNGCAILVRSDLRTIPNKSDCVFEDVMLADDAVLRVKAAAEGKLVLKHNSLFFRCLQSMSNDKGSSWHDSRESRNLCTVKTREFLLTNWPKLFLGFSSTKLRPIWQAKGKALAGMVKREELLPTKFGYVPNPSALKEKKVQKTLLEAFGETYELKPTKPATPRKDRPRS